MLHEQNGGRSPIRIEHDELDISSAEQVTAGTSQLWQYELFGSSAESTSEPSSVRRTNPGQDAELVGVGGQRLPRVGDSVTGQGQEYDFDRPRWAASQF